jgi:hypothetical protein
MTSKSTAKPELALKSPKVLRTKSAKVFTSIYQSNFWRGQESVSGEGSSMDQTAAIRAALPSLIQELAIQSMLDIPCGDCYWMSTLDLDIDYIGGDIVADLVIKAQERYGSARRRFANLDVRSSDLPPVDLILCRDCLVHLRSHEVRKAIQNMRNSGARWLLATTFTRRLTNEQLPEGLWRPLNLELADFDLGPADRIISEECFAYGDEWSDKSLGLWRLN